MMLFPELNIYEPNKFIGNEGFRPILASSVIYDKLIFPLYVQPKYDGVRCLMNNKTFFTRELVPMTNNYLQMKAKELENSELVVDGELFAGNFKDSDILVSTKYLQRDFIVYVFDVDIEEPYHLRLEYLNQLKLPAYCKIIETTVVNNLVELMELNTLHLRQGHEGSVIKDPYGFYKYGRSTVNEQYLLRMKPKFDCEATIYGFNERMKNISLRKTNELGLTKKSSSRAEDKVSTSMLGSLRVKNAQFGAFEVGTGFTDEERIEIWDNRDNFIGKTVVIEYGGIGTQGKPRFPSYKGFRNDLNTENNDN